MADLGDIVVVRREDRTSEIGEDSPTRTEKNFGRGALYGSQNRGNSKVDGGGGLTRRTTEGEEEGPMPQQEYLRARFYKHHQKEAEEYDRAFMKGGLDGMLISALSFSGVVSAFIITIHSRFHPNLNEKTNALRVIIHAMDSTIFGGQVPTVLQWTGPPRTIVHVQAILFASLSASLLSVFLAMLSKRWLNRCTPVNMRGTIIERNQYRQRKLDGTVNWYFGHVMKLLPLMLQAAILLFIYAISRYLWEFDRAVALGALRLISFGFLLSLFIIIAGAASMYRP